MKVKLVRACRIAGEPHEVGAVLDVADGLGMELIGMRKAIGHVPAEKPARARKAKAEEAPQEDQAQGSE